MDKVTQIVLIVVLVILGGVVALDKINETRETNFGNIEKKLDELIKVNKESKCNCNHNGRGNIGAVGSTPVKE